MRTPTWILGYHGCDRQVGEAVLEGKNTLHASENQWDWLGTGIYFWENSARRALDWAEFAKAHPTYFTAPVREPFVIGAVIDLGNCLDLLEAASIRVVKKAHADLRQLYTALGSPLPVNEGTTPDRPVRRLDCAVINYVHDTQDRANKPAFDSVRAAFIEGSRLYEGAFFHSRTHIQICVRHETQIIGYFRVRDPEVVVVLNSSNVSAAVRRTSHRRKD